MKIPFLHIITFYIFSTVYLCALFCVYYFVQLSIFFHFLAFQTERTYFQVYLPKESKDSSQPMFFCSKWSVGKVVDFAASLASLKNSNNILTAKVTDNRNRVTDNHREVCTAHSCLPLNE